MRTDELIRALVQDARGAPVALPLQLSGAIAAGGIVAAVLFGAVLGTRPDLAAAAGSWRFLFKLAVPAIAFVAAFWACVKLSRPDQDVRAVAPALLVLPLLAIAGVVAELVLTPASSWTGRALGRYSVTCLVAIPSLSAVSLLAVLAILKRGAPGSPAIAGGAGGLLAATLSASIYALHCPDDSPLFFALWYLAAVSIVVIVGLLCGRHVLRW